MKKASTMLTTKGGEKMMKKLNLVLIIGLIMAFALSFNAYAVPSYGNVGPTSDFNGDVGTTGGYYINGTLLSISDITTAGLVDEAMLKAIDAPADEEILTYEVTTGDFEWELPDELFAAGTNLTWNEDHVTIDVDDAFLLNTGDIGTGVYDFGGADSFEIPNKNADPAVTGQILLDTTVADMTNGNLAFYDGTAVRYVISLAAADIWSTDDYVVAYDADADKFYMKEDANTGFSGNFLDHFMDVDAADTDYVHAAIAGTGGSNDVSTEITNPDYGRIATVTCTNNNSPTGNVTITGNLADGTTAQTDVIAITPGGTAVGVKPFVVITSINVPAGVPAEDSVTIGIGDVFGLTNPISAESDIYNLVIDGVNTFSGISGNGDTTYNTIDLSTVSQNSDYTVYYHN